MSVVLPIEEDPRFRLYTASAGQTQFAVPFPFQQDDDIALLLRNAEGDFDELSQALYSLAGANEPEGGIATFLGGRTAGDIILVLGRAVLDRLSSIVNSGRFASALTDAEFDRNRIIQQEQSRDIGRAVKVQFGEPAQELPSAEPGKVLGWGAAGLANLEVAAGDFVVGAVGKNIALSGTIDEAQDAIGLPPRDPATFLGVSDDGEDFETLTAAEARARLDPVETKIAGVDSTARSPVARFGDTLDIREFGFVLTGAVGSEAANNAALDRLIAHATLNPGMVYRGRMGDYIRFNAGGKTIPKCKLRLEGAEFHWVGNSSASAAPVLTLGQHVDFDALEAAVPAGGLFRRMFRINGDGRGDYITVECENQVANYGGSNLDYGVAVYGHRNKIRSVKTKNVDWGAFVYGEGSVGNPQLGTTVGEFDIENYAVGFVIRNVTRFANPLARVRGKSPNALPDPGFNACLIEGVRDSVFGDYQLFDAGEHNLRFGGVHSGEQLTRNCSFASLLSGRAGQCGFKVWSGLNTDVIRGMTFGQMNIFDCGLYAQMGNTAPPQFNDFGAMVQGLSYSSFGVINVYKQDAAYSSLDAAYFSQCQDVQVDQLNGYGAKRNILRISEYNGNGTDSNPTNSLAFSRVNGSGHEAEGIYVQVPTNSMRDLSVDDFHIIGGTDGVRWDGALARAVQPCYFRGGARGFSGSKFNVPGGTNIKTLDKFA